MAEGSWTNPKLEVRQSSMGGRSVFAKEPVQKGELLTLEIAGQCRVIDAAAYWAEVARYGDLAYNIGVDQYVAPLDPVNPEASWLVNHSCEPNAVGIADDSLMAWRDIGPGEEITYDYATTEENPDWRMECRCGSANCRGMITGNDWKLPKIQERYAGYFTQSLAAKIAVLRAESDSRLVS